MRRAAVLLGIALVGCRPAPRPIGGDESAVPPPRPGVLADVRAEPKPDVGGDEGDPFCKRRIYRFGPPGGGEATVQDVLAQSEEVYVVRPELRDSDCSGIGWMHVSFVPVDTDNARLQRAYGRQRLPAMLPKPTALYLMGARRESPRRVDLNHVCVTFSETVTMRVDWILPVPDEREAEAIDGKLREGACGRPGASATDSAR